MYCDFLKFNVKAIKGVRNLLWLQDRLCSVPGMEHDKDKVLGVWIGLTRKQEVVDAEKSTHLQKGPCIFPFSIAIYMLPIFQCFFEKKFLLQQFG